MTEREQRKLDIVRHGMDTRAFLGLRPAPKSCSTAGGIAWAKKDLKALQIRKLCTDDPVKLALIDDEIRSDEGMIEFLSYFVTGRPETCAYTTTGRRDLIEWEPVVE